MPADVAAPLVQTRELSYAEAIREGLAQAMEADERVFLFGEDVGVYGGAFGVSGDLVHRFGKERVIDTPISELSLAGAAVGAALTGMRPVLEIQFSDFVTLAMEQIVNQAAKIRFMFGGKASVPMVVRLPGGSGTGAAAQHSQSLEAWFAHVPGLKVVQPSTPHDAKGLLLAAIDDPNPVLVFEHKLLYKTKGIVPDSPYRVPIGSAAVRRRGRDLTIVAASIMAIRAAAAAERLAGEGIDAEVIDLRSLRPIDFPTIAESVRKTHRLLIVYEGVKTMGIGAEIAAQVAESEVFDFLDAPIARLGGADVPIPYNPKLEKAAVPQEDDIVAAARKLVRHGGSLMAIEVVLPKVDMDMDSGTIAVWRVAEGDLVRQGDVLFEMETDKSVMEVESPGSGRIRDLAAITGEPVPVGTPVAWIDALSERAPLRATPLARKQAKERGVALETIAGSGPRGRIVASDVEASSRSPEPATRDGPAGSVVPFTPVRRIVAHRLAESARSVPHFHLTAHIEMTALRASLERHAAAGVRPTMTVLLVKRVADVLARHPGLNASVEGEAIRLHAQVDVGVAMDRDGDLLVPVLRDASTRSLAQLVTEFIRLKDAVHARTIAPSDLRGSTFTVSNLGMYGVDAFTAIINPPECAILAIGRTVDTPVGREGRIVLRPMATFTLSSDHRIVDGAAAARFMADLRRAIEDPDL